MSLGEFELIARYFAPEAGQRKDVVVGIGDDAAVLEPPAGMQLVVSTDTLVSGVHFPAGTAPAAVGYKALAVNLSDLAAMGATPAWFTLNLSLPAADEVWVADFARGLFEIAREFRLQLIGGDTTQGALAITITVFGIVPQGTALRRQGARAGDRVYVTGQLGDACLGLGVIRGTLDLPVEYHRRVLARLERPLPRVREGERLRGVASACIDLSDGLIADLGHIVAASGVGARIDLPRLPLSPAYHAALGQVGWEAALAHGDDYELCFTVPPDKQMAFHRLLPQFECGFAHIGDIEPAAGIRVFDAEGHTYTPKSRGYRHFESAP